MFLKEVELENFKSFGRKISIPFMRGFTAITGPNGSGKSNISDAILFVLGPKSSKAIRAGKLTDLIFNGGKNKKPSKFCKVTLVFDNDDRVIPIDNDEVRLTRHVRISKTMKDNYYSYFYVNGKPSSLNEFDNLLAHARISAEGYNLVQQGDINSMTQLSPLDRRKMLDDVAGITKFDKDISKAEDKGRQVDENLDRIGILVEEIKRQLKELDKDRNDALKFKELKEKLNVYKILLGVKRKENLELQIKTLDEQISKYEQNKIDMEEKTDVTKQKLKETMTQLETVEKKLAELAGDEAQEIKDKIDEIKLNKFRAKDSEENAKNDIADYKREKSKITNDLKTATKELTEYQRSYEDIEAELVENKGRKTQLAKDLKELEDLASKSDDDILVMRREITKLGKSLESLRDEIHQGNLNKDRTEERQGRLELEINEAEEQIKKYEFSLHENSILMKELKEGKSEEDSVKGLNSRLNNARQTEEKLHLQAKDLEDLVRKLSREHAQAKMQADAAAMVQSGYTKAVQAILDARDMGKLRGIHGTIAELGNVNEKYNDAMIVAAGGRMQSIVVDNDESAAKAITFLKKNNIGRAVFFPLNKLVVGKPGARALMAVQDERSIGFAIDLVKFESKYKPAFWYVFGDTVVSMDLTSARKLMGGVRLVTLDGELVEAGGAMHGGMAPRKSLKFGIPTESEINKISKKLQEAIAHADKVAKEIQEVKTEVLGLEDRLRKSSHAENSISQKLKELESEKVQLEDKLKQSKDVFTKLSTESEVLVSELEKLVKHVEKLSGDYSTMEGERDGKQELMLKATSKEIADKIKNLREDNIGLKELILDMDSRKQTLNTHIKLYKEKCDEHNNSLEEIEGKLKENIEKIEGSKKNYKGFDDELNTLMRVEAAMTKDQIKLNDERDKLRDREHKLRTDLEKIDEKILAFSDLILNTGSTIQSISAELGEVVSEIQHYNYNEEDLAGETKTLDELKKLIPDYERRLDGLQPVNLRAIDEFNAQNERLEKLNEEVSLLEDQKENLNKLVEELMQKKKEGLMIVFNAVNENFQEIFGELTRGGTAELLLEKPKAIFEGGLIIKARPRNKKLLKLESLSGGEKSLTALALIFAIQRYQPSPFYVLDEVDMFLDAINAENVGRMVTKNAEFAQFILVSLRKVTFKNASHVYGVTMQGTGISYLIGKINLAEVGDDGEIMKDLKNAGSEPLEGLPESTGG